MSVLVLVLVCDLGDGGGIRPLVLGPPDVDFIAHSQLPLRLLALALEKRVEILVRLRCLFFVFACIMYI